MLIGYIFVQTAKKSHYIVRTLHVVKIHYRRITQNEPSLSHLYYKLAQLPHILRLPQSFFIIGFNSRHQVLLLQNCSRVRELEENTLGMG
jgi:hypothetical protein